jgi:hypothetical protein
MAKKNSKVTPIELPGVEGKGVSPLVIPEIAKAINTYERKKEKRCEISPGEISAKRDLKELLVKHRDELPLNEDGHRFYRHEGVDYIIDDVLKRRSADDGTASGE